MSNEINNLKELRSSNYEIADGDPDIRGWDIMLQGGLNIGEVDELLFDEDSRKVRYLIVDIDKEYSGAKKDRKVLIPIGLASLHKDNDEVLLPNTTQEQLALLPDYEKGSLNVATEKIIRNVFEGTAVAGITAGAINAGSDNSKDFYDHDHFDEEKMYQGRQQTGEQTIPIIKENINIGKRIVETGGINVHTNIIEEPVEKTVNLKEEHITVERKPVDKSLTDAGFATFQESTVELTEYAEVPVISKEARVVEEISFKKEVDERDETIRDTVRETEVEVEQINKSSKRDS